jgi:hypothetical protein
VDVTRVAAYQDYNTFGPIDAHRLSPINEVFFGGKNFLYKEVIFLKAPIVQCSAVQSANLKYFLPQAV